MDASIAAPPSASEAAALWQSVHIAAAVRLPQAARDAITKSTRSIELTPTTLRVATVGEDAARWVREGWLSTLDATLESLSEGSQELAIVPLRTRADLERRDPAFAFDTFLTSPANREVRARAEAFGRGEPGALLLWGPGAAGKSHLLRAIGNELAEQGHVLARTAEELSMALIDAIWSDGVADFRERLAGASAMIIDDLQTLGGREATQEELLRSVEEMRERGAPVVLACAKSPGKLTGLIDPLRRWLSDSVEAVGVTPPEWETRVAIVLDRMRRWEIESPSAEVAAFLASKLRTTLDRLDATLTRLMTHPSCANGINDVEIVRHVLNDGARRSIRVSPDEVIGLVARHFNIRIRDLRSASRSPRVTTPRQIAMYLVRRHCALSYPEIGRRFARHHTTALHSDRLVQRKLENNSSLRSAVVLLEKELLRMSEESG